MRKEFDIIVVGAGPAGLAAALEAARQGLDVVAFEAVKPGGQALAANRVDNFPGYPEGIPGRELMGRWVRHAKACDIRMVRKRVTKLAKVGGLFSAETGSDRILGRTAIIASGLVPKNLDIPGERELIGKRLFSYVEPATLLHSDKRVLIIGGGDAAFDMAISFAAAARDVTVVVRGASPKCTGPLMERAKSAGVNVLAGHRILSMSEHIYGASVEISDGSRSRTVDSDIIVACVGKRSSLDFMDPSLCEDTPGLFFAGDLRHGRQRHISMAAGEGTAAAAAAAEYLKAVTRDS